jgi:hypothetical protein
MGIWALAILGGAISGKQDHCDRHTDRHLGHSQRTHRELNG